MGFVVLEIVTSLAGSRDVFRCAFAASGERDDVFIGKCVRAIIFLANTVFTAVLGAFLDQ